MAVRANSETGDEKSWQTKAVMRGWAGLGQVEGAHSIMSGGKCLSSPSAASAASAAVSIYRICSHHDMQLQSEDVTAV